METRRPIRALVVVAALATAAGLLASPPAQARPAVVLQPVPIELTVGPTVVAPDPLSATARIVPGPPTVTGSLVLSLYPPGSGCAGTPTQSATTMLVDGAAEVTLNRVPDSPGTWLWRATYSGKGLFAATATACTPQTVLPARTKPWYPFASARAFVIRQYIDLLVRQPTTAELEEWTILLTTRTRTPDDLVVALRGSVDHLGNVDPATRLYFAYFLRIPDANGLRFWIDRRRGGQSLASISDFFAHSAEFQHRYGALSDQAFVELIYRNILGRAGEESGVDYWTNALMTGAFTRGAVMVGFSESPEYRRQTSAQVTVAVLYVLMLGRAPTQAEFDHDVAALGTGAMTTAGLVHEIRFSAEYVARWGG